MASFNFGTTPSFTGTNTTSTPAFTGFGSQVSSITTPATQGFGFGSFGTNISTPSTNFGFGTNPVTTSSGFGFGSTGIGLGGGLGTSTTTSAPTLFSGFGSTTATTTSAPTFSFSGLGTSGSAVGTGFSGGTLGGSLFPSGAPSFGTSLGSFGTGTLGSSALAPGSLGSSSINTGNFGFGSSGIGGFGNPTGTTGFSSFLQGPGANVTSTHALTNLATALSCPLVFGDERDVILAKWNKLQAFWGTGKGVFSSSGQFVEFSADNPFCRFKAVGYSCVPGAKNEDGFVAMTLNKKSIDVVAQQQQFVDSISRILGSRPTLSVCVEGVVPLPDNKTEVIIYILERAPTGASRRIPSSELFAFLIQNNIKAQLTSLGIEAVIPKTAPNKEQLQQYLNNPPAGIDPLLWQQSKLDNPDADHLIPVPMIGFSELQLRLKYQEQETKQYQGRLDLIAEEIVELQRSHANSVAKIAELKRKQLDLGHRVLKVMVKQETTRKLGYAIQADEEQLRVQLEAILAELNAPTQFKGRLNELISQIRMQNQQILLRSDDRYVIDNTLQDDIKQVLKQQQDGISHLINIIRTDLEDLKLMENGLKETIHNR